MSEKNERLPSHKELEKELSSYLTEKYGDRIKIVSPEGFPEKEPLDQDGSDKKRKKGRAGINFSVKPEELEAFLDQYIVCQADAKGVLSTKICTHFNRIRYAQEHPEAEESIVGGIKNNILLIGPTGVGKTYIIKLIANRIGVPFVKCDATKFSETGYVGGDVEDIIRDLVREANDDIELAECGIVYIDEIDKIAGNQHLMGPDVSRSGVQRALLKPMEETEVDLKTPHDPISMLQEIEHYRKTGKREKRTVNTKNILFIMSGAFNDLAEIIMKRVRDREIGFGGSVTRNDDKTSFLKYTKSQDLIQFGFESEFIGRIPVVSVLERLSEEDLYTILKNPNNPIILSKKRDFMAYGIQIKFEDSALSLLAKKAFLEQTGARGLVSAMERTLLNFEKRLPSTETRKLAVTEDVARYPQRELDALLAGLSDGKWDEIFERIEKEEKGAVNSYLAENKTDLSERCGLPLSESRLDLIALYYACHEVDVMTAIEKIKIIFAQIRQLEVYFAKSNSIQITFDDRACDVIAAMITESTKTFGEFYKALKEDLEYGLRIIQEETGTQEFILTPESLLSPEEYLDGMMKAASADDMEMDSDQPE